MESLWWQSRWLIIVGVLALASNARAVVVSFETSEGFPDPDGTIFNGLTNAPAGVVDKWSSLANENSQVFELKIDQGPGGGGFGDEPAPITGSQIALNQSIGAGSAITEMDLNNGANLSLVSFYYANRGGYPPILTVDYYGLSETLLGSDTYTGPWVGGVGIGLGFGFEPKFQLLTPTAPFLGVALSKVVFKSSPPNPMSSHGSFSMEDITLNAVPEPASFALMGLGGIAAVALRRWKR